MVVDCLLADEALVVVRLGVGETDYDWRLTDILLYDGHGEHARRIWLARRSDPLQEPSVLCSSPDGAMLYLYMRNDRDWESDFYGAHLMSTPARPLILAIDLGKMIGDYLKIPAVCAPLRWSHNHTAMCVTPTAICYCNGDNRKVFYYSIGERQWFYIEPPWQHANSFHTVTYISTSKERHAQCDDSDERIVFVGGQEHHEALGAPGVRRECYMLIVSPRRTRSPNTLTDMLTQPTVDIQTGGVRTPDVAIQTDNVRTPDADIQTDGVRNLADDGRKLAWVKLPSMPTPRAAHQAVVAHGRLIVAGGWGEPTVRGSVRAVPLDYTVIELDLHPWLTRQTSADAVDTDASWRRLPKLSAGVSPDRFDPSDVMLVHENDRLVVSVRSLHREADAKDSPTVFVLRYAKSGPQASHWISNETNESSETNSFSCLWRANPHDDRQMMFTATVAPPKVHPSLNVLDIPAIDYETVK